MPTAIDCVVNRLQAYRIWVLETCQQVKTSSLIWAEGHQLRHLRCDYRLIFSNQVLKRWRIYRWVMTDENSMPASSGRRLKNIEEASIRTVSWQKYSLWIAKRGRECLVWECLMHEKLTQISETNQIYFLINACWRLNMLTRDLTWFGKWSIFKK